MIEPQVERRFQKAVAQFEALELRARFISELGNYLDRENRENRFKLLCLLRDEVDNERKKLFDDFAAVL